MTKRYSLRINAKDKGVKIFDNIDDDNWRILNLHFNNYEDTQFVKSKLIPVVALLNEHYDEIVNLQKENEQLKKNCKNYEWYKQYKQVVNENEQLQLTLQSERRELINANNNYRNKLSELEELRREITE